MWSDTWRAGADVVSGVPSARRRERRETGRTPLTSSALPTHTPPHISSLTSLPSPLPRHLGSSPRTSVRQDVGRLRLSPSISSGGTREPRWVSDERRRERTAYGTVFHPSFTSPFFPRSYVTRLVTLTSFLGADWVEWEEATRIEVKRAEFQPFVDSVLLTLSPLASFACHSLRSLGGAGPEDGSERGWMACSRAERTEGTG